MASPQPSWSGGVPERAEPTGEEPHEGPEVDLGERLVVLARTEDAVQVVGTRDAGAAVPRERNAQPHTAGESKVVPILAEFADEAPVYDVERRRQGNHRVENGPRNPSGCYGDRWHAVAARQDQRMLAGVRKEGAGEVAVGSVVLAGEAVAVLAQSPQPETTLTWGLQSSHVVLDVRPRASDRGSAVVGAPWRDVRLGQGSRGLAEGTQQAGAGRCLPHVVPARAHATIERDRHRQGRRYSLANCGGEDVTDDEPLSG